MEDLPTKPFEEWTMGDVTAFAAGEPQGVMPGTGRKVPGPRRRLLLAMTEACAETVADLDPIVRDRHLFSLLMMGEDWSGLGAKLR